MTDSELALQARADPAALEILLRQYKNMVRRRARTFYLSGADEEDMVQEGMIGLFKAVRDYDPQKNASFSAFASLCVQRQLVSALKHSLRQKNLPLKEYVSLSAPQYEEGPAILERLPTGGPNPESVLMQREEDNSIDQRVSKALSPLERQVLHYYLEGRSYSWMAAQLNTTRKSVDNALNRLRRKLERTFRAKRPLQ